jgi:hypothetical protein
MEQVVTQDTYHVFVQDFVDVEAGKTEKNKIQE